MRSTSTLIGFFAIFTAVTSLRFDQQYIGHNLNTNESAIHPLDYNGAWDNHTYHASPANWRMPFYTASLFADEQGTC